MATIRERAERVVAAAGYANGHQQEADQREVGNFTLRVTAPEFRERATEAVLRLLRVEYLPGAEPLAVTAEERAECFADAIVALLTEEQGR